MKNSYKTVRLKQNGNNYSYSISLAVKLKKEAAKEKRSLNVSLKF